MSRDDIVLSVDCGTQSLRTLLFSAKGELLHKVQVQYEPYFSANPGWAEQDPEVYWSGLCKGCRLLKAEAPHLFQKIAGIGITTQRNTMVNVDSTGSPLRAAVTWLDQRKALQVYMPSTVRNLGYRIVGMDEAIRRVQKDGKSNWIRQYQPDIWDRTHKYLQVSGFLNFRLTGEFVDSIASQIGHLPFNFKKMRWCKRRELNSRLFPIEREKLPVIVQPGSIIGKVTARAAREAGLVEGTPVIACGSDKGCETLGMGVLDRTMASLSFGTTATVQTTSHKYFEPLRFMPAYPAPIPGRYNPEVEIFRGYWMVTWFKNEFAHKEELEAKEKGLPPEAILNKLLSRTPPGSMGLMVQPYWGPGLKHPSAKGCMIGFGDVHSKAHVYRAVIEGLGFALMDGLHRIEKAGGVRAEKVAVSGGASQSDEICHISADIFNLPLVKGKTYDTSGLGAAIVTCVGLGLHSSFEEAVHHMVLYDQVFEPNPENVDVYGSLYRRVYRKLYGALRPLYREIRDITGYPER